jgi:hypothetical protein
LLVRIDQLEARDKTREIELARQTADLARQTAERENERARVRELEAELRRQRASDQPDNYFKGY